jgi:hypothetical protein
VQGSLQIKNVPTGAGDTINIQGVYTDGATRYNFQSLSVQSYGMYGSTSNPFAYQSVALAAVADGVFATGTGIDTVKTWGMRGAWNHNFDPYWSGAIYGAYAQVKYGNNGAALICGAFAVLAATALVTNCDPNFNVAQLGGIIRWTPVKNLTFSVDTIWTHIDQKFEGLVALPTQAGIAKPPALYELKDQDTVTMLVRAQRNF